jgi:hypothetical protein
MKQEITDIEYNEKRDDLFFVVNDYMVTIRSDKRVIVEIKDPVVMKYTNVFLTIETLKKIIKLWEGRKNGKDISEEN